MSNPDLIVTDRTRHALSVQKVHCTPRAEARQPLKIPSKQPPCRISHELKNALVAYNIEQSFDQGGTYLR